MRTATYDAWAAYDPVAVGTRPDGPGQQAGGDEETKREAISYAAYRVLIDLLPPTASPEIPAAPGYKTSDKLFAALGYDPANETLDPSTPAGVGNLAAKAVLDFRHNDDSNQLNGYADTTGYQSKNTWDNVAAPWYWQPLCVLTPAGVTAGAAPTPTTGTCTAPNHTIQQPLTPQWANVIPARRLDVTGRVGQRSCGRKPVACWRVMSSPWNPSV